jgi:4a-hydroxytetrahydrobiopterin dehydratase
VASAAALRRGADAAVSRLGTSGTSTVALGGSDASALAAFAAALSDAPTAGGMLSFLPVSSTAAAVVAKHNLPLCSAAADVALIDFYVAAVAQMDDDLNAALSATDGHALQSERFMASQAEKALLIVDEAYYTATSDGLLSFHAALDPAMPTRAVETIRSSSILKDFGVLDATLRTENVADVLLTASADLFAIDAALGAMPGVSAVGILPTSPNVTAIVASADHVVELVSPLASLVSLAEGPHDALEVLEGSARASAIAQLGPGWSLTTDGRVAASRQFWFKDPENAMAFANRVHRVAALANSFPEISINFNRVRVHIATVEAHGITPLDIALALEITRTCDSLHGCKV